MKGCASSTVYENVEDDDPGGKSSPQAEIWTQADQQRVSSPVEVSFNRQINTGHNKKEASLFGDDPGGKSSPQEEIQPQADRQGGFTHRLVPIGS